MTWQAENLARIRGMEHVVLGRSLSYDLKDELQCPHRGPVRWEDLPYEEAQRQVARANVERTERRQLKEPSPISEAEILLLAALLYYGEQPRLQYPVGPYDLDFLIEDYRAAIEVDGREYHDVVRDGRRDRRILKLAGIRTYRITARDVFLDPLWSVRSICKAVIHDRKGTPCPTS